MRRPLFWVCLLLSLAACLRFWLAGGFLPKGTAGAPPECDGQVILSGTVCGRELTAQKKCILIRIQFSNLSQNAADSQQILTYLKQNKTEKLLCYLTEEPCKSLPKIGSQVTVCGSFSAYGPATNPGEFDFEKYYRADGIGGKLSNAQILQNGESYSRIGEGLLRLREFLGARLDKVFPEKEAGLLKTMLLGDRSELDPELKKLYREGGILHILSISGLHITLLGMGIYRLLRKVGAHPAVCALASSVILVLYGMMTGMRVSACRAIGMFLLRMLALLLGRTYDLLTALAVLGAGMLCLSPQTMLSSGFWLSFGSLYGVGAILPCLEKLAEEPAWMKQNETGKGKRAAVGFLRASSNAARGGSAVLLASLPLQLYFYCEVPVYSVLINLLVLPCMGLVVCSGFLAMLTGIECFAWMDTLLLRGFEGLCKMAGKLPLSAWNPGAPKLWQMILYYAALAAVLFGLRSWSEAQKKRRAGGIPVGYRAQAAEHPGGESAFQKIRWWEEGWKWVLKWCMLCLPIIILALPVHRMTGVIFLDVGQGDAVCLRLKNGQTWLYDCGSTSRSKPGENILLPYLKHEGIRQINGVFLSHDDKDHISGLLELFDAAQQGEYRIERVILSVCHKGAETEWMAQLRRMEKQGLFEMVFVNAGDEIAGRDVSFDVLSPDGGDLYLSSDRNRNAESLCILAKLRQGEETMRILLTGDAEGVGERTMTETLKEKGISSVNVLKCAHHGSQNATSEEFLDVVGAQVTVISCGRKNRYGHPHEALLNRLEKTGSRILRTDESGAIIVKMRKDQFTVEEFCP